VPGKMPVPPPAKVPAKKAPGKGKSAGNDLGY
jgi:hypothetical protein